jgi:hypothetical protein
MEDELAARGGGIDGLLQTLKPRRHAQPDR